MTQELEEGSRAGQRLTGRGGTSRMRKCRAMDMATAASSQGFSQGGIRSSDWFSETLLRAHGALTSDQDVGRPRSGPPPIPQVRCREELVCFSVVLQNPECFWECSQKWCVAIAHSAPRGQSWGSDPLSLTLRPNPGPSISSDINHVSLDPLDPNSSPHWLSKSSSGPF